MSTVFPNTVCVIERHSVIQNDQECHVNRSNSVQMVGPTYVFPSWYYRTHLFLLPLSKRLEILVIDTRTKQTLCMLTISFVDSLKLGFNKTELLWCYPSDSRLQKCRNSRQKSELCEAGHVLCRTSTTWHCSNPWGREGRRQREV